MIGFGSTAFHNSHNSQTATPIIITHRARKCRVERSALYTIRSQGSITGSAAPVQSFPTFTGYRHRLADWLTACRITHVAMEATGVYWIPTFEILDARGFQVILVNARHVKNLPGRKKNSEHEPGTLNREP